MKLRNEHIVMEGIRGKLRVLHLSDTHFSPMLSYDKNLRKAKHIAEMAIRTKPDVIAVTGDLVSRTASDQSIFVSCQLMMHMRDHAPVLYTLGNHETDLPKRKLQRLLFFLRKQNITILHNSMTEIGGVQFYGLTLPTTVYQNENGGYGNLTPITVETVEKRLGKCQKPCVLLAHSPMGFPAYAQWGADVVLSGHVHGGIVRLPGVGGILSPERRFLPEYTKGLYRCRSSIMEVSAGIGKLRICNPAEEVLITLTD